MGNGGTGFGGANFFFRIIVIHEQVDFVIDAFEFGIPFAAGRGDGFGIMHIDLFFRQYQASVRYIAPVST